MDASKLAGQLRSLAERFRDNANSDSGETDVTATTAVCGPVLPRMRDAGLIRANLISEPSAADLQEHAGQPDVIAHLWSVCWENFVAVISHPRINPGFPIPNPLAIKSEYRGGPSDITAGGTDTADWRIRARNYAALCDALADETETAINGRGDAAIEKNTADDSTLDERAVATKVLHPEWTDQQVADAIGCKRQTLFKPNMVKYRQAKEAIKSGRERYRQPAPRSRTNEV